jgi:hypothetical protein
MSNNKESELRVFCDTEEIAEKISSNLENSVAINSQVFVSDTVSESDIREAARNAGVSKFQYSSTQIEET